AADPRATPQPTASPGLADAHGAMLPVADDADGGAALEQHQANFAGGHADVSVLALLGHQLARGACGADQLPAPAGPELDVVDHSAERDPLQRKRVADLGVDVLARDHLVADVPALRPEDVPLLAVDVLDERDPRRPVGLVLDGDDLPVESGEASRRARVCS